MDGGPESRICSFCGTPGSPHNRLAGGLGAMICLECLEYYYEHSRSPERVAAASRPVWEEMSDAQLLATLPLILRSAEQNAEFAGQWVEIIRARNISWAAVGKCLGVSRQAAWERFASRVSAKSGDSR